MRLLFLLTLFFSFAASNAYAQEKCKTDILHQKLLQNDVAYRQKYEEIEKIADESIKTKSIARLQGTIVKVPVVVHIMHVGSAAGTGENISDDQIHSAIQSLNNSYRKIAGTAGDGNGVDIEVEFCLAQKDANGNAHSGINRVNATTSIGDYATSGITDANETSVKALSKWPNTKYYNIWIVSEIDGNNAGGGTQGYAYFPGASSTYDGAVILYNSFGFDPDGSRGYNLKSYTNMNVTTIHELGHAFGLYHTFQGDAAGCPTNTNCTTEGDRVCDTPPHERSSSNCVVGTNPCDGGSSTELFIHNYMDYSSDACQTDFTAGQSTRMKAQIAASRSVLVSASNLAACGCDGSMAPIARFYTTGGACEETPVQFVDESINFPTSWQWTFEGGTPPTSTSQHPIVTFSGAGPYDVTLTVGSSQGVNKVLTKPSLVSPIVAYSTPFSQNFEAATFAPTGWSISNPDNGVAAFGTNGTKGWVRYATAGNGASTNSAALNCYNYNTTSPVKIDGLITPPINLSGVISPSLTFKVAHKYYPSYDDILRVLVSEDCGVSYDTLYTKSGATLATNGSSSASFVPAVAGDWRTETVNLSAYTGSVIINFQVTNDYGNNIFIDDVLVEGTGFSPPVADFTASSTAPGIGDVITFYKNTTGQISTYTWDFGDDASLPAGTTGAGPHQVSYSAIGPKTVSLAVSGAGGSDTETKTAYINVVLTGVTNAIEDEGIVIFPNPASSVVEIKSQHSQIKNIQVYDAVGKLSRELTLDSYNTLMNIEGLAKGVYTLKIITKNKVVTRKFIVS